MLDVTELQENQILQNNGFAEVVNKKYNPVGKRMNFLTNGLYTKTQVLEITDLVSAELPNLFYHRQ